MTSSWKPHKSIRYKGSHEPGAHTNRNCIPKKSRTLMTMTSKFHPWFRRKSILTRHLNTLRGLRYHGLDMRVRCVTWTTLCHNNVSFWLLTSTKLLMIVHILGSLMGLTNLVLKWRNLKHFSYVWLPLNQFTRLQWKSFRYWQTLVVFQQFHFILWHKSWFFGSLSGHLSHILGMSGIPSNLV